MLERELIFVTFVMSIITKKMRIYCSNWGLKLTFTDSDPRCSISDPLLKPAELVLAFIINNVLW